MLRIAAGRSSSRCSRARAGSKARRPPQAPRRSSATYASRISREAKTPSSYVISRATPFTPRATEASSVPREQTLATVITSSAGPQRAAAADSVAPVAYSLRCRSLWRSRSRGRPSGHPRGTLHTHMHRYVGECAASSPFTPHSSHPHSQVRGRVRGGGNRPGPRRAPCAWPSAGAGSGGLTSLLQPYHLSPTF